MFILFEGPEYCGKSTQARRMARWLGELFPGTTVHHFAEPKSGSLGAPLRELLLHADFPICPEAELFLFLASRAQLMRQEIAPALKRDDIVVLDRSTLSTLAYQVAGRGLPMHWALPAIEAATCGLVPDVTFLLSISPQEAASRAAARGRSLDRIEGAGDAFHERVAQGYWKFADILAHRSEHPWNIIQTDVSGCDEVAAEGRLRLLLESSQAFQDFTYRTYGIVG